MSSDIAPRVLDLILGGKAQMSDIDDYVRRWHESDTPLPLHDYLGMSWEEYAEWGANPQSLASIIANRRDAARWQPLPRGGDGNQTAAAGRPKDSFEVDPYVQITSSAALVARVEALLEMHLLPPEISQRPRTAGGFKVLKVAA